jgi:hypothetical protein
MSDIEQFFQQPFVGPVFGMMCFFAILLVVVIVGIVISRRRRAQRKARESAPVPSFYGGGDIGGMEMPDLDSLVSVPPSLTPAPGVAAVQPVITAAAVTPPVHATRKGTFTVNLNDGPATEAVEVMSILRDVVDGNLIVQMGDKTYQSINSDTDFKERFNKIMRELAQAVKAPSGTPAPAASPEAAPTAPDEPVTATSMPEAIEPEASAPVMPPQPPAPAPAATSVPKPAGAPLPGDLPKFTLDDQTPLSMFRRGQKAEKKPVPEINIAGAIEAYLQYKLRNTPEYAGRSIHVYPAPDGGVSIEVDGQYFDAVGDVTDPSVREFLATTIQEWQERH